MIDQAILTIGGKRYFVRSFDQCCGQLSDRSEASGPDHLSFPIPGVVTPSDAGTRGGTVVPTPCVPARLFVSLHTSEISRGH